jgi:hypothetical protein
MRHDCTRYRMLTRRHCAAAAQRKRRNGGQKKLLIHVLPSFFSKTGLIDCPSDEALQGLHVPASAIITQHEFSLFAANISPQKFHAKIEHAVKLHHL